MDHPPRPPAKLTIPGFRRREKREHELTRGLFIGQPRVVHTTERSYYEERSEGGREGSTQKPTYILSMRFYRQEYIKRHDLFHGRTGPVRDRAKTHKQARYTLIIQWKFRQDLRNIHGKLARFMAWPVLPVYARRLRASHILSDKRYETSVEAATATRKHLHTNESRCFFAPLRKRHTPRISTVAQISSDPSPPPPPFFVSPRIFPSDLVQPRFVRATRCEFWASFSA